MVPIRMADIEKEWSKSLFVMSNVIVFARQDGRPASWLTGGMNTTDYIDPYVTHMDQKPLWGLRDSVWIINDCCDV